MTYLQSTLGASFLAYPGQRKLRETGEDMVQMKNGSLQFFHRMQMQSSRWC